MRHRCLATCLVMDFLILGFSSSVLKANPNGNNYLSLRAAEAAVKFCLEKNYHVTATVVNKDGLVVAVFRGEEATPHTLDSSKQKAYTAATLASIVNLDKTSEIAERILSNQFSAQLANLPNILLIGGGVAIRSEGKVIGGIGVGGAPGGNLDEACALAGASTVSQNHF